jgi:glutamate-ammonia-ligase adenylyltransferase
MAAGEEDRRTSPAGRLARLGFTDADRAGSTLAAPSLAPLVGWPDVLDALAASADPDLALTGLLRLTEATPDRATLLAALRTDPTVRARLLAVLGASAALADHLVRHPTHWHQLEQRPAEAAEGATRDSPPEGAQDVPPSAVELGTSLLRATDGTPAGGTADALRVAYRRHLLLLAARDLTGADPLEATAAALADLAGATLEAALAIARAELSAGSAPCRLAIIAMGKCGGRELNYVSDVDVVFVAEPVEQPVEQPRSEATDEQEALRTATRLATAVMRVCSATTAEGTIWPVDAALRPEGKAGPLVRTLASHRTYYERWAKTWEFQALLKARPIAGDRDLGRRYVETIAPLVWEAAARPDFVADVQAMRRRVADNVPTAHAERQLKLGPGGLRDVEFAVQLLQLVHGRADEGLRVGDTLGALQALSANGYVGREDAARLAAAYRFLRTLEHRIQLFRLRRTHVLPDGEQDLRRLGRSLGLRGDPVGELDREWRQHAREVRRLHEKLFYRPLLGAVARLDSGEMRLTPDAARARLQALGYADPAGALRHLEALTAGVSRRAAIQRTLLPVMLGWFADAADPDAGLLSFRKVSEALGTTPWYLRVLRDEGVTAQRLATLLASSRYAADLLLRAPESVALLADDAELVPRPRAALVAECLAGVGRHDDPAAAVAAARGVRRRELFRVAAADLLGLVDLDNVGEALSDVAAATVAGAVEAAVRAVEAERDGPLPTAFAVIAMGRFGGHELSYGSDADVLFVHEPLPGVQEQAATEAAHRVALELRRLLALPAADPPLGLDADLRPEGRAGPLVRTLSSYARYYAGWSHVWESQALVRAEPVAGDVALGERFRALIDPVRYPGAGLEDAAVREIRRIKARVEAERLPRGADPVLHTKLGRGGLADVEWTVQLLQLRHAHAVPALRTTRTTAALSAAAQAGLLTAADAATLLEAWRAASRVRNAVLLWRGRAGDSVPTDAREAGGVARIVGYAPAQTGTLRDDYRRLTRRARGVVERTFYA